MEFKYHTCGLSNLMKSMQNTLSALTRDDLQCSLAASANLGIALNAFASECAHFSTLSSAQAVAALSAVLQGLQSSLSSTAVDVAKIDFSDLTSNGHNLIKRACETVSVAYPHMTEAQREEYEESILPAIKAPSESSSFKAIVGLIELLLMILTFIVTTLPDAQLVEIAEQNKQLIAIEQERLDLERQRVEALDTLACDVAETIALLSDHIKANAQQCEILCDERKRLDDFEIPENPEDGQSCLNQHVDIDD